MHHCRLIALGGIKRRENEVFSEPVRDPILFAEGYMDGLELAQARSIHASYCRGWLLGQVEGAWHLWKEGQCLLDSNRVVTLNVRA
jgi:hypothetical protein